MSHGLRTRRPLTYGKSIVVWRFPDACEDEPTNNGQPNIQMEPTRFSVCAMMATRGSFGALAGRERSDLATWLEFHDSTLAAFNHTVKDVEVVLDAYVHRWDTFGDSWTGTGWMQPVRILISDIGERAIAPLLPVDVSHGRLQVGTTCHSNLVRLPFNASSAISLWLQLMNADVLEFIGRGVHIDAVGEARFVEDLPADLRPSDAG
jgi:hypothetical protein